MSGDVLAPRDPRVMVRGDDLAALAARARPGVADAVQPVAAQLGRGLPDSYRFHGDSVEHVAKYPAPAVTRQCIACGCVAECDPSLPCATCGASPFHLIPLPPAA